MPKGVGELHTYDPTITDQLAGGKCHKHEVWISDQPFGSGGCRQAFLCQISGSGRKFVAKKYLRDEGFVEDYISSQIAATCARAYNQLGPPKRISYLIGNRILNLNEQDYCIEEYLDGQWQKHNDIFGNILSQKRSPDTFSHFTWEFSRQRYMILDVQGVGETFTDPAVVSVEVRRFGYTDTGLKGIRDFFANHKCNEICKALGLKEVRTKDLPDTLKWFDDPEKPLPSLDHHQNLVPHKVKAQQQKAAIAAAAAKAAEEKAAQEKAAAANKPPSVDILATWMDLSVFELKKLLTQANRPFDTTGAEKRDLVVELASAYYPLYRIPDTMWREVDERRRAKAAVAATPTPISPVLSSPLVSSPATPVVAPAVVAAAGARPASTGGAPQGGVSSARQSSSGGAHPQKPQVVSAAANARPPQVVQQAQVGPPSPAVPPPAAPYPHSSSNPYPGIQQVQGNQKSQNLNVSNNGGGYGRPLNLPPRPLVYDEANPQDNDLTIIPNQAKSDGYPLSARDNGNSGAYVRTSAYTSTPPRPTNKSGNVQPKPPSPPNFLAPRPSPTGGTSTNEYKNVHEQQQQYYPLNTSSSNPPPPLVPHAYWGNNWR